MHAGPQPERRAPRTGSAGRAEATRRGGWRPVRLALRLGLLALLGGGPAAAQGYLDRVSGALKLAEDGRWAEANQEFATASSQDPDDALGYVGQGVCRLAKGELDAAAALFRRAEECPSRDTSAWVGLGLCFFEIGRLDQAEAWLTRARTQDAILASPPFYLSVIRLCQGRLDDASELLSRARDNAAPDPLIDYVDALRQAGAGRWQQASDLLRHLKPRLQRVIEGKLPLPLPLRFEQNGQMVTFAIPERAAFSDQVAPKAYQAATPVGEPVRAGPLTVMQPRPNEVVSGKVTIRADLRQPRQYQYVAFEVDGRLLTMTNREPFYTVWDSTQAADGAHRLTARAAGSNAVEVALEVQVQNAASGRRYDAAMMKIASRRLSGMMLHGQPPTSVEKLLLQTTVERNPEEGIEELERRVSEDTVRLDLLDSLVALYKRQEWAYPLDRIPEVVAGRAGGCRVSLTFDDGPRPGYTERLLQLLRENDARGTFFVTGEMSQKHPDLVKQILAEGHEVASHTYRHPHLTDLGLSPAMLELIRAKVAIERVAGRPIPRFYRPPFGKYDRRVREASAAVGQFPILWSLNATDFIRVAPSVATVTLLRRVKDGDIVLMHNGNVGNTNDILPLLLPQLRRRGVKLVRVSEIIEPPVSAPGLSFRPYGPLPDHELRKYAGKE